MKNIIVAWCNANSKQFESQVPLEFIGERNMKLGFGNDFDVVFIDGYRHLSIAYTESLKNLGYRLHNLQTVYNEISKQYGELNRFGDYEKKCFLRWVAVDKYFNGEKIVHYDGDIVFNEDPRIIAEKVKDLTFVLKGCPAFTVINDQMWFEQYIDELNKFTFDIKGYSEDAWKQRAGWEKTNDSKWAGYRSREIISSDQDFISHLIHTDKIVQNRPSVVLERLKDYIVFESPFVPDQTTKEAPFKYRRDNGIDYLNDKKVLFWHMQSCFNFYLSKAMFRRKYLKFMPIARLGLDYDRKNFESKFNRMIAKKTKHTSRLSVYKFFFEETDFSSILNNNNWWKKNFFI